MFTNFDALGADAHRLGAAIHVRPDALEVREPPALGEVVGVAHVVPYARLLPADIAFLGHGGTPSRNTLYTKFGAFLQ